MAVYARAKRVTDPLNDKVKARIRGDDRFITGYASSGSEHDALSGLVHAFLESDGPNSLTASAAASDGGEESNSEDRDRSVEVATKVKDLLDPSGKGDLFRLRLVADVSEAAEALAELRWNGSGYRRAVMVRLREGGYNAGICKVRWGSSGRLTAGSYEYIDVVVDAAKELAAAAARYIVDVGFAAEFEVARATEEYGKMLVALPRVMVARPEEVRQVVHIAAEAARRSLRRRGMHVPPWRKGRYMLAKWLGPYRRTVNPLPASAGAVVAGVGEAKCCAVGFQAVPPVAVPPATRTQ